MLFLFAANQSRASGKSRWESGFPSHAKLCLYTGLVLLIYSCSPGSWQVKSRGVISLDGPDVFKFLQGLITNDVHRLEGIPESAVPTPSPTTPVAMTPPMYTALLSPQGRFLYDLVLYRPTQSVERLDRSGSGPDTEGNGVPALVADVDTAEVDNIISHLKRSVRSFSSSSLWEKRFRGSLVELSSGVGTTSHQNPLMKLPWPSLRKGNSYWVHINALRTV